MAQSTVDACNSALQKLGAGRILSLSDNTREARACNVAYDSNRRDELRKYYWSFAMKRVVLAPDATAPAFEYTYAFTLPSDFLRIILPNDATLDWKKEGKKILTNWPTSPQFQSATKNPNTLGSPSLALRYIADITDEASWDPSFYNVFSISLALDLVEELTQSNQKKQALMEEYKDAIGQARKADAFEKLPLDAPDDMWWLARY